MKILHIRNATFIIDTGVYRILVDPMLSKKGELPPFAYLRYKPRKNPIVPLPENAAQWIEKVSHCLITHSQKLGITALQHTDHLDDRGEVFLRGKKYR